MTAGPQLFGPGQRGQAPLPEELLALQLGLTGGLCCKAFCGFWLRFADLEWRFFVVVACGGRLFVFAVVFVAERLIFRPFFLLLL